ncbi:Rho-binding antiterminator [Bowmanella denitrificans]|uniref:Rho-binding antiterminator n=1 Tax=Bowmanella denitrificans TaxID=366582 RepID=A0ABP3HJ62_9ALTE
MKTPTNKSIACAVHDYIEVACLYGYRLELWLLNGSQRSGVALTTRTQAGSEWLVLEDGSGNFELELNQIARIRALTDNQYFTELDVQQGHCGL